MANSGLTFTPPESAPSGQFWGIYALIGWVRVNKRITINKQALHFNLLIHCSLSKFIWWNSDAWLQFRFNWRRHVHYGKENKAFAMRKYPSLRSLTWSRRRGPSRFRRGRSEEDRGHGSVDIVSAIGCSRPCRICCPVRLWTEPDIRSPPPHTVLSAPCLFPAQRKTCQPQERTGMQQCNDIVNSCSAQGAI